MARRKVIAIAGMPGAGKGFVSRTASFRGIPVLVCGDVIRKETEKRGLVLTPENMGAVMLALRREEGLAVVAERLIPQMQSLASPVVVVEGVRSMDEVDALRKEHEVATVAVHASPRTRFERLTSRARSDDPKNWQEFMERDSRELGVGIGSVIALAEEMLVNEGSTDELTTASEHIISKMVRK
jgi:dephospho-CoA kinase